jgi:uncharacterized membrane protein YhaH (DUF805 family)
MIPYLLFSLLVVVPLWRICERAGLSGAISLIALFPFVGLLAVGAILSFSQWRITEQGVN